MFRYMYGDNTTLPTGTHPTCLRCCHSCCLGKKIGAECNNCRRRQNPKLTNLQPVTSFSETPVAKSAQKSERPLQNRPSVPAGPCRISARFGLKQTPSRKKLPGDNKNENSELNSPHDTDKDNTQRGNKKQQRDTDDRRVTGSQASNHAGDTATSSSSTSNKTLLTSATGEDFPELQKSRTSDAPLGDASLLGITNILIPVSTMELFFQRFDMLEWQLDELKTLVSWDSSPRNASATLLEGSAAIGA